MTAVTVRETTPTLVIWKTVKRGMRGREGKTLLNKGTRVLLLQTVHLEVKYYWIFSIIAVAARSITLSGMFCASSNGYNNLIFHLNPPLSYVIHPLILRIFSAPILQRKSEE